MLPFWIIFIIYVWRLPCFLVCSLQPCGHLLRKEYLLALLYVMFSCVSVTFLCGVLCQEWYLIVSILIFVFLLTFFSHHNFILFICSPMMKHCLRRYSRFVNCEKLSILTAKTVIASLEMFFSSILVHLYYLQNELQTALMR